MDEYEKLLAQVLATVPPPSLAQLVAHGTRLLQRVEMPEADPDEAEPEDDE